MSSKVWDEITIPNFNGCTVEVCEWISDFIPHFIMDVITNLCWDIPEETKRGIGYLKN